MAPDQLESTRDQLERVARVYKTNKDASQALGIATRTFTRQCERLGVLPPSKRARGAIARRAD